MRAWRLPTSFWKGPDSIRMIFWKIYVHAVYSLYNLDRWNQKMFVYINLIHVGFPNWNLSRPDIKFCSTTRPQAYICLPPGHVPWFFFALLLVEAGHWSNQLEAYWSSIQHGDSFSMQSSNAVVPTRPEPYTLTIQFRADTMGIFGPQTWICSKSTFLYI
jgi:hypothetical protein